MKEIPLSVVRDLAKKLKFDGMIVLGFENQKGPAQFAATSYGKDRKTCDKYGVVLDQIVDALVQGLIMVPADKSVCPSNPLIALSDNDRNMIEQAPDDGVWRAVKQVHPVADIMEKYNLSPDILRLFRDKRDRLILASETLLSDPGDSPPTDQE